MKFVVDSMLGKLAKWLKILGFDVVYLSKAEDAELLSLARREGRILLTKDHGLLERAKSVPSLFVESENWEEQVKQVLHDFDLKKEARPYTRCLPCNVEIKNLPKQRAKNLVTPFVYEKAQSFAICPSCGRVFWQGTHFEDMEFKIEALLKGKRRARSRKPGPPKPVRDSG